MDTNQYAKINNRVLFNHRVRTLAPGRMTMILSAASRAENGSANLTAAQYTTLVTPYIRTPNGPV